MQSEKGLEDHSKTLSLTVQTTGSHEGLQGARATGRRVAAGPSAVRLGNSLNFSESWFHHLYTGLVGINISLQNSKLEYLCSAHRETFRPCSPVKGCRKEINITPPQDWLFPEISARLRTFLLYFLTSFPSLFYKRT